MASQKPFSRDLGGIKLFNFIIDIYVGKMRKDSGGKKGGEKVRTHTDGCKCSG